MDCPKCGEYIDRSIFASDVTFCPYCGQDLKQAPPPVTLSYCPYCGQELVPGARFCPNCGKKLSLKVKRQDGVLAVGTADYQGGPPFWRKALDSTARLLTYLFTSERKTRRLYDQWAEYADLSPEEIKALEAQNEMSEEWKKREQVLKITVIAISVLIVLIVVIALLVIYVF